MNSDTPCTPGTPGETGDEHFTLTPSAVTLLSSLQSETKTKPVFFHLPRYQLSRLFAQEGIFFGSL